MNRFIKLFWFLSTVAFLAILLWVYADMTAQVDVSVDTKRLSQLVVSRNTFFYVMVVVVVLTNASLLGFYKMLSIISRRAVKPEDIIRNESHNTRIVNWIGSFAIVLNLFYCIGVVFIGLHNALENTASTSNSYIVYFGLGLIFIWLIGLAYILATRSRRTK